VASPCDPLAFQASISSSDTAHSKLNALHRAAACGNGRFPVGARTDAHALRLIPHTFPSSGLSQAKPVGAQSLSGRNHGSREALNSDTMGGIGFLSEDGKKSSAPGQLPDWLFSLPTILHSQEDISSLESVRTIVGGKGRPMPPMNFQTCPSACLYPSWVSRPKSSVVTQSSRSPSAASHRFLFACYGTNSWRWPIAPSSDGEFGLWGWVAIVSPSERQQPILSWQKEGIKCQISPNKVVVITGASAVLRKHGSPLAGNGGGRASERGAKIGVDASSGQLTAKGGSARASTDVTGAEKKFEALVRGHRDKYAEIDSIGTISGDHAHRHLWRRQGENGIELSM